LPPHVSVHIYDHLQRAREQYFMQLLSWIPLMYGHCVYINGIHLSNCTKYCSRTLWKWS